MSSVTTAIANVRLLGMKRLLATLAVLLSVVGLVAWLYAAGSAIDVIRRQDWFGCCGLALLYMVVVALSYPIERYLRGRSGG